LKLKQYLFSQFSSIFFPIFFGLYFITSIIFLVRIASLTSIIKINAFELFQLYIYVVPMIIFYTLPISFFVSLVLALSKLSSEYELIVITSFGLSPLKVLRFFFPITLALCATLIIISLGLMPKVKYLNKRFLEHKKSEASFNIKASEFAQKFDNWLIYVSEKKDKMYKNIKLFQTENQTDQFITGESAILKNDKGELKFRLTNGKFFNIKDQEFNQINYKTLDINSSIIDNKTQKFTTAYDYWIEKIKRNEKKDTLAFCILTSFFPLMSFLLVLGFGYYNPRYEKNQAVILSVSSVLVYYILIQVAANKVELHALYLIPILWLLTTYYFYKKNIKSKY